MREIELGELSIDELRDIKQGSKLRLLENITVLSWDDSSSLTGLPAAKLIYEVGAILSLEEISIEETCDEEGDLDGDHEIYVYVFGYSKSISPYKLALIQAPINYKGELNAYTSSFIRR